MRHVLCLVSVVLIGCSEQDARSPGQAASTPGDTAPAAPAPTSNYFDAGTLAVGDTFLGLRVTSVDVRRVFEDSVWTGDVRFEGEIEVAGVYQPHFDYPEVNALCFHLDSISAQRIPEWAPDKWSSPNGKPWFCFSNPDSARAWLGPPDSSRHARIVIDRYHQTRHFTDAWDVAALSRVLERGVARARTLSDTGRFAR